jgi:hypothetical protein
MTRYLIFQTLANAATAERVIFAFGVELAKAAGQVVTEAGIFGVRSGSPVSDGAAADRWAMPIKLNDGTYALLHPAELKVEDAEVLAAGLLETLPPHVVVVEPYVTDRID